MEHFGFLEIEKKIFKQRLYVFDQLYNSLFNVYITHSLQYHTTRK
jgi:hypothetical protein